MKIILASHGSLADAMLEVLHAIMGDEDDVEAFSLNTYEDPVKLSEAVKQKIDAESGKPVILVSDIKGGSTFNHLLPFCVRPEVTLFAGMNLNLVLNLVNIQSAAEEDLLEVIDEAKAAIEYFNSEILQKMSSENDADAF